MMRGDRMEHYKAGELLVSDVKDVKHPVSEYIRDILLDARLHPEFYEMGHNINNVRDTSSDLVSPGPGW